MDTNIADVIDWKFDGQSGMVCKPDNDGVMQIVEFPGGIPSKALQDTWISEFNTRSVGKRKTNRLINRDDLFGLVFKLALRLQNQIQVLNSAPTLTRAQYADIVRTAHNSKPGDLGAVLGRKRPNR